MAAREGQPGHREHPLERHQQPGPAGDQHRQPRTARQQPLEQARDPIKQMLAVVQDQQRFPCREPAEDDVLARAPLTLAEPERGRDRRGDHRRVGDRHEIHVPGAVRVPAGQLGDHAQGQARLADPARADGGHQAVRADRVGQRRPFGDPPYERGQRRRQRQGHRGPRVRTRRSRRCGAQCRRGGSQRPAVIHLELTQQRGNVTLDGADRDEQPGGDLRVGQVLPDRGQHLSLTGRHARPGSHHPRTHTQILPEPPAAPLAPARYPALVSPGRGGAGPVRRRGRCPRPAPRRRRPPPRSGWWARSPGRGPAGRRRA